MDAVEVWWPGAPASDHRSPSWSHDPEDAAASRAGVSGLHGSRAPGQAYGGERVSAACQRALQTNGISYTSVHAILENGLDRVPVVIEASRRSCPSSTPTCAGRLLPADTAMLEA